MAAPPLPPRPPGMLAGRGGMPPPLPPGVHAAAALAASSSSMYGGGSKMPPPLPPGMAAAVAAAARPPPGSAAPAADKAYGSSSSGGNSGTTPLAPPMIDRTRYLVPPGMAGAPPLPPMSMSAQKPPSPQPPYPPTPQNSGSSSGSGGNGNAAAPPPPPGMRAPYRDYYNAPPPHAYGEHAGPGGGGGYYPSYYDGPDAPPPPLPQHRGGGGGYPPMPPAPGLTSPYARGGFYRSGGGGRMAYEDQMPMREPTNTVWVGNLDPIEHNEDVLRREMREFGMIMRVAKQAEKSYCFVHYRRVEEARNAVETLTRRGSLGQAKFNYGKMFEYTPEEMALPYDPSAAAHALPRRRDERCGTMIGGSGSNGAAAGAGGAMASSSGSGAGYGYGAASGAPSAAAMMGPGLSRRARQDHSEPTNVLWVGSLPPTISDDRLREVFEVFGTVKLVSRMDKGGMAFVHFDTVEHCTLALQTMTGRPIDNGVVLALNYGHAPRTTPRSSEALSEGVLASETATNVVYMGQLPSDTTDGDVEQLFAAQEGFIFSKYIATGAIAFGHYDTIEHARAARIALHGSTLHGTPIRVSFGKNNHSYTMADRYKQHEDGNSGDGALMLAAYGGAGGGDGDFNLDAMMRDPAEMDAATGALMVGGSGGGGGGGANGALALTLPARGGAAAAAAAAAERVAGGVYTRVRAAPEVTLDVRLQTLLSTLYNECGAQGLELSPSQVQAICNMVDHCVDEVTAQRLDETLTLYTPLKSVHVFSIVAKRMHAHYNDDPHKKLLILYAATRVLLGAVTDYVHYTSAALNAYLMVLLVASAGQTSSGVDRLVAILESLQHHSFIEKKAKVSKEYVDEFREQLDEVLQRARAEQDLSSLLTKRRRRAAE